MKYYTYSQYTGKTRQKRIFRTVLICSLTAGILWGTAVLGNLFKDRLSRSEGLLSLEPKDYAPPVETAAMPVYTAPADKRPMTAHGISAPILPADFADEKTLSRALDEAALSHTGISVTAADKSGSRFSAESGNKATLADAVLLGAARELSVSATLHTTGSADTDKSLVKELFLSGVTEVLLCGLTGDTLDGEYTYTLLVYLEQIREEAPGMTVGIALSPALLQSARAAVHLDTLFSYYDYFAIDLTGSDSGESVKNSLDALYGSIAYYNLAVLLSADKADDILPEQWEKAGIKNARFLS